MVERCQPPLGVNVASALASLLSVPSFEPGRAGGGLVVNLGAALIPAGSRSARSNVDESWLFFFQHAIALNLSMIAFECNPASSASNEIMLHKSHPSLLPRITSVRSYVSARTIDAELERRGVGAAPPLRHPVLLKVRPPSRAECGYLRL